MKKIKNKEFLLNILLFIILPFVINIVLESMGNKSYFGGIKKMVDDPYVFLCNTLIIATTISVGVFFRRFRCFWIELISIVWILLGTINCIIISNRVLPLTPYDLQLIDAMPFIIKRYLSPAFLAIVCLGIVFSMLGLVVSFFRAFAEPMQKGRYKMPLVFFVIMTAVTYGNLKYAVCAGHLEKRFPELAKSYVDNGFAYSFMIGLVDNGVDKVDGYSKELMTSIADDFIATDTENVKTPNIVFVQMESFFDVSGLRCVEFSKNPIPNFTKLMSDYPSGLLTVPVIGAGTVNTEFEVVTGMRVVDFGAGEYPYKTILKDNTCESIATNLKEYGYTSHFIHNYKGGFYGRNNVYANLGYDYFYSIEYMTGYETNENGWAKDDILLRYISESLDSTAGSDLITAVSVQGHGSYSGKTDFTKHLTVTDCDDKALRSSYEYYGNQIYEMDQFLGKLVDLVSKREEDTILVVYGDHLPSLDIKNKNLKNRTIYQTDYFIWNNIGLEYREEDLASYQLSSKILESIGVADGVINSCHQQFKEHDKYLYNLQALEYDILYGEKYVYNGKNPYPVSKMKENYRTIVINRVTRKEKEEETYVVNGDGFTEKSYVRVGYRVVTTNFIDECTLEFKYDDIDSDTPISVWEKDIGKSNSCFLE